MFTLKHQCKPFRYSGMMQHHNQLKMPTPLHQEYDLLFEVHFKLSTSGEVAHHTELAGVFYFDYEADLRQTLVRCGLFTDSFDDDVLDFILFILKESNESRVSDWHINADGNYWVFLEFTNQELYYLFQYIRRKLYNPVFYMTDWACDNNRKNWRKDVYKQPES